MPVPLGMENQISILMPHAGDELGDKYAGAEEEGRAIRGAASSRGL